MKAVEARERKAEAQTNLEEAPPVYYERLSYCNGYLDCHQKAEALAEKARIVVAETEDSDQRKDLEKALKEWRREA